MSLGEKTITELDYPIINIWIFKHTFFGFWLILLILILTTILFSVAAGEMVLGDFFTPLLFLYFFSFIFYFLPFSIFKKIEINNFHYSIEEETLKIRQGVFDINETFVFYKNIRSVFIVQNLFDKIFNIYSVHIDILDAQANLNKYSRYSIGFNKNKLIIPGLKKTSAEALKKIFLQKIKETQIDEIKF